MSLAVRTSLVVAPKVTLSVRPQRRTAVQCVASNEAAPAPSRRFALGLFAAAAAGAVLSVAGEASAITIPSQSSTGSLGSESGGKGSMAKNASAASMSAYDMTGTVKRGLSPKRREKVLAKVRAQGAAAKAGQ